MDGLFKIVWGMVMTPKTEITKPPVSGNWAFVVRVIVKTGVLFFLCNLIFVVTQPLEIVGKISLYNTFLPGRERLPYGERAEQSYNLSLNNLPAMFASHVIAQDKESDEYRVILIGDSGTWGMLLEPHETLAGQVNTANYQTADGKWVRAYNLGHPIMSLTKDLLILDYAMRYEPDLVIWLFTLESFPRDKQLFPPLVQNNADTVRQLIETYDLQLDKDDARFVESTLWDKTIIGGRRALADLIRLQIYGGLWAATGIDQYYPPTYPLRQSNFSEDISWQALSTEQPLTDDYLAFDVLAAGIARVGDTPILLVNEAMFISDGRNSALRYNFFYPRWAYDAYRVLLHQKARDKGWWLLDLWNVIAPEEFTDSPVHLTPAGNAELSRLLARAIVAIADGEPDRAPIVNPRVFGG